MSISNRDYVTLEWVRDFVGYGRVWQVQDHSTFKRSAPCHQWDCSSKGIRATLPRLIPYLRINLSRARAMQKYLDAVNSKRNKKIPNELKVYRESLIPFINGRQLVWGNKRGV